MVRRALTEPKTALAGVALEISFARFKASIATFKEERRPSRVFDSWGLVAIVEVGFGCEWTVQRASHEGRAAILSRDASCEHSHPVEKFACVDASWAVGNMSTDHSDYSHCTPRHHCSRGTPDSSASGATVLRAHKFYSRRRRRSRRGAMFGRD